MRTRVAARFSALFVALAFVRAHGADYYVSTQGNDSSPGTASQPFRTITRAYKLAGPGVTINVMPGVYTDYTSGWGLRLGASGTASSPIVLKSTVKGGAIIDGQNLLDRNKGIYLDGSYNVVDGFEIRGGPNGGITIWGNYNQILSNEIHHNGNPASSSTNGKDGCYADQSTHNNSYKWNYVHDNGRAGSNLDHGFYLCGDNEVVLNNIVVRNAATGLQIAGYTTVSNMKVYNNVVAFNGTSGIILWQALSGVDIKNNIIYQNGSYGINSWEAHGSGVVVDHNLLYGNGSGAYNFTRGGSDYSYTEGSTISSAPQFVNSSSSGFDPHLSSSSPAIGTGLNLSSTFNTDKDGAAWPSSGAWDQGAYRYGGSGDTTPPSVWVSAPGNNATVSGASVTVSASASDNVGVAGVQFKLDGTNLGGEDTSAPYSVAWNTTTIANGSHTLSASARDSAGNESTATQVTIEVSNVAPLPSVTVTATDTNATEADRETGVFTITRTGDTASDLVVSFTLGGTATGGDDYAALDMSVSLPVGAASATVLVTPIDDSAVEEAETVVITLAASSTYNVGSPASAIVTIADNDSGSSKPIVTVTATDAKAAETGLDPGMFTFTRTGGTTSPLTVKYGLSGTATRWNDYRNVEGDMPDSITIPAGASFATVSIYPVSDTEVEGTESVIVTVAPDAAYAIGSGTSATVNIADARRVRRQASTGSDTDGDGIADRDELMAGTDPNNLRSVLEISSVAPGAGGSIDLTWPSVTGKTYRVSFAESLEDGYWIDVSEDIVADDVTTKWTDTGIGSGPMRFYSVTVVTP